MVSRAVVQKGWHANANRSWNLLGLFQRSVCTVSLYSSGRNSRSLECERCVQDAHFLRTFQGFFHLHLHPEGSQASHNRIHTRALQKEQGRQDKDLKKTICCSSLPANGGLEASQTKASNRRRIPNPRSLELRVDDFDIIRSTRQPRRPINKFRQELTDLSGSHALCCKF